jgi:translation initiation factor 1
MAMSVRSNSPTPKIRLEKRSGKTVTIVSGLHTYGVERLEKIAKELKSTLGAGGTVKNSIIEIQGDKVTPIKIWFERSKV